MLANSLGAWSRRLICNASVIVGSMKYTVKLAHEGGYGVLILNPNAHHWVNNEATVRAYLEFWYTLIEKYVIFTLAHPVVSGISIFLDSSPNPRRNGVRPRYVYERSISLIYGTFYQ